MVDKGRSVTEIGWSKAIRFPTLSLDGAKLGHLYNEKRRSLALNLRYIAHVLHATLLNIRHVVLDADNLSGSIAGDRGIMAFHLRP